MSQLVRAPGSPSSSAVSKPEPLKQRIRDAILHDLTTEERLLILLWHAEGMDASEIATILNSTASRVTELHESLIDRIRGKTVAEATWG